MTATKGGSRHSKISGGLPLLPWLVGIGTLTAYGTLMEPPTFEGGTIVVAILAGLSASAPFLKRAIKRPWLLEAGLAPLILLVAILPLPLRTYPPRLILGAGLALVVAGYFLISFSRRLEDAQNDEAEGKTRDVGAAWRFAWARVGIVTVLASALALLATQIPRWGGALIGQRWASSVDAISPHAFAWTGIILLAIGTGVTLLRVAKTAAPGGHGVTEESKDPKGDASPSTDGGR